MSSDGERMSKPSKRRLAISDSDSSDESIIVRTHHKRRIYRVVSDVESSDEDSDVPRPVTKRKNHRLISENELSYGSSESEATGSNFIESDTSSDWQSDWESIDELEETAAATSPKAKRSKKSQKNVEDKGPSASTSTAGFDSDNSDGQSEKCPICLLPFRKQEIATPSSCEHCFCLECILEWSKNINTCPVDRQIFTVIHVRSKSGGTIVRHVPIEVKKQPEVVIQEDPTYCEICHLCDREDRMLLCDGCDLGYHLECLEPPMTGVPMDEWYCPECSQNSQNDAEAVDIDLDEIPDLMEEARRLGNTYGRTRTGRAQNTFSPRIIPRTRQTERVRANIRAGRDRNRSRETHEREVRDREARERRRAFNPDQPSTSSGIDSIGENSRSRSPDVNAPSTSSGRTTSSRRATTKRKSKKRISKPRSGTVLREVRITEINDDGEEEEIVTYVKVKATTTTTCKKKKYKKRKKRKSKRARTVLSVANANKSSKRRLAAALKMSKPIKGVPLLVPTVKNVLPISDRSELISSRYRAGISQVSLFGNNLGLDYSPPGSDDEIDSTVGHGPAIIARSRGPISTTRRRMALKGIANPTPRIEQTSSANILDSIISSQELWHSRKSSEVTLKANGTLVIVNNDAENGHSINNNESPVKKKAESDAQEKLSNSDQPLDLSNVNPNDITQAPMYNSPRGGGSRGNFRGGYRDNNRQGQGGQGYGGRDSYSGGGRRSYGGSGLRDDFGNRDFGPPVNYSTNFEHRAPAPFGTPPFRNRNPQQFRNDRNRYSLPERPPFPEGDERLPFPFPDNFQRGPPPLIPPLIPPGSLRMPIGQNNLPPPAVQEEFPGGMSSQQSQEPFESQIPSEFTESHTNKPNDEECDIYGDMEGSNKATDSEIQNECANISSTLLPPPEPPSGLLDFDENSKSEKDNDSDHELVIDDTPKDDAAKAGKNDDKYDPFNAEESDSNDSSPGKEKSNLNVDNIPAPLDAPPLEPPPSLENFSGLNILNTDDDFQEPIKSSIRLTAYDDEDDEDSQADCPNFSIYSSETMDVARHTEQELSQQIGPLEPPPLPPEIPDMPEDDDVIVGDVQACDLSDIPEPSTPYVEALQKERQTISKIPSKKISSNDSRGKITFKINTLKLNNKFGNLYDEMDKEIENAIEQEKNNEEKEEKEEKEKTDAEEKNDSDEAFITNIKEEKKRKKKKKKKRRVSEDMDVDSEDTKDTVREEEQSELPTQKIQIEGSESQEFEFDNSELLTQNLDISELQTQKLDSSEEQSQGLDISEFPTQNLDSLDSQSQNLDNSQLPTQKLGAEFESQAFDSSDLATQKLDESELQTQNYDISEPETQTLDESDLPTQKLDVSESEKGDTDISELQTQRLYSPEPGVPTLYSPDVPIPTLYSPEPEKSEGMKEAEDDRKTPDENREKIKVGSEGEEPNLAGENEISRTSGDEGEMEEVEGSLGKEISDSASRDNRSGLDALDRSPETVISIADTTQSSQNDDCEIVESRIEEEPGSNNYIGMVSMEMQTEEDQNEISRQERVDGEEDFPLEKEGHSSQREVPSQETWDSDGGYTPCKDELPLKERRKRTISPFDQSGLEPITPTKDKNDDLDRCRTPPAYAGLGTEAISETDEAMNFEDELTLLSLRKEKEMEEGEILEDGRLIRRGKSKDKEDDSKKKKKKDKKDKNKESEKNKENISSENLVSWKKVSKSTKDRNYREKDRRSRSREKDKDKKKKKESMKKKEKRRELPRYDVRKIVSEKPRPRKDEYGRDIRDFSRSLTRSKSRSRSLSKARRSVSKARRSRSYSRVRSKSRSRSKRRSWTRELPITSRGRSYSRGRSLSPRRRKSPRRSSTSRKRRSRSLSRRRRSVSPRGRDRRKRSHSRKRKSRTRSRSRDRRKEKKKHKSRSRSRNRKRSRSKSAKRAASRSREKKHPKRKQISRSRSLARSFSQERDRNRNWEMNEKVMSREQHFRERDDRESWSAQWTPSLSASRSKTPDRGNQLSRGWTPTHGLENITVPPKNLTVILTNKEAIKKKKKDKKKERRKSKESEKRKKGKRARTPPPSKEVFASGDNILVSVCFNKDNESNQMQAPELPETIPLMPPTKRRRREPLQIEPPKKAKKDKAKEKRAKSPKVKKDKKKKSKAAEIAATKKPVAVIDLDQSPFREQTPSPRDVIVLSDDDEKQAQALIAMEPRQSSQTTPPRDQFVSQGPKTPPEPQVKFSINKQANNLRPSMMNPLMEEEEEEEIDERVEEELEMRAQEELELRLKIGPNTPPEPPSSPPTSPDAYDPFDPTKSRSPTPVQSQEATPLNDERNQRASPRKHDTTETPLTSNETQDQEKQSSDKQVEKPKIISMVTIKRASPKRDTSPANDSQTDVAIVSESPTKSQQSQQNAQSTAAPFPTINPVLATVAAAVQRSSIFNANAPASTQRNLTLTNRISPSTQNKQRPLERPQLPNLFANSVKTIPLRTSKPATKTNALGQNGNDTEMINDMLDMSSPYSPGSSLSDGIFDPPSPYNTPPPEKSKSKGSKDSKKEAFDILFGTSPAGRNSNKVKVKKDKRKKCVYPVVSATNPKVGVRMDENQLQILDDLPSSAVEMQVKDKFLKKLNRQERVVEEVKLVLKPHYTKKHVTKEEYKDIMRKAVPKICHNRSGEINPKKIAALIEAYVKKCRGIKKRAPTTISTASKMAKTVKTLWS